MKIVLERAYKHLSNDKIMYFLINKFKHKIDWGNRYNSNYALSIANLIIEQQISFKAAITVKKRFSKLTDGKTSEEIIKMTNQELQSIGISYRKADYIKNVFNFFNTSSYAFKYSLALVPASSGIFKILLNFPISFSEPEPG